MSQDAEILCSDFDRPAVEGTLEVLGQAGIEHEALVMPGHHTPSARDRGKRLVAAGVTDSAALSGNWRTSPPVAGELATTTSIVRASGDGT